MRNAFWGTYYTIAFKTSYYKTYQAYAETRLFWAKTICAVVSILSVLVWGISKSLPVLWAALIALAQLAQTLIGFLPWSQQASALRYLVPELDALLVELYGDWLRYGADENANRELLAEKAVSYQRRFYELANRYTADIWFPARQRIIEQAEKDCNQQLDALFPTEEGADDNETEHESPESEAKQLRGEEAGVNSAEGKDPSA